MRRRRKARRCLVVDASVARAAGGIDATHQVSKACRNFLDGVLKICHSALMSKSIREEWNKHQSNYARGWRVQMVSRKKLMITEDKVDMNLRSRIASVTRPKDYEELDKDFHLVEASLTADLIIASLDEAMRLLLRGCYDKVSELRSIIWVNPAQDAELVLEWLKEGANSEPSRQLGH